jgi:deoxyribodipyrimidine photo-lyase
VDKVVLFWFRRDLRLNDNAGLYQALVSKKEVLPFFLFDKNILDHLEDKADARVHFIHQQIASIKLQLQDLGSDILVDYGTPVESFKSIISNYPLSAVYTNRDYEPYALKRDKEVSDLLAENSISFLDFKDHVIFEKDEVLKENGEPYVVFTPYSKAWKKRLMFDPIKTFPSEEHWSEFQKQWKFPLPDIGTLGFGESDIPIPRKEVNQQLIVNYSKNRDYPALNGTSRLGIHFRFGSISMREKAKKASLLNETFLNELIWRDFYHMILFHFPKVAEESFKSDYDKIILRNSESVFD